jgi:Zn-dependent protease
MALISFFSAAVILFMVFPIRECARGFVAKYLGDDTAERQGKLTLNPMVHLDPMGALMLLFLPMGWPRPTPINIGRCNRVKAKTAVVLTSAAGPAALIILAYFFMLIFKIVLKTGVLEGSTLMYMSLAVSIIIQINLFLAVLNLLPVPPFDGSKVLFAFLRPDTVFKIMRYQQMIYLAFILLLFMPGSPLVFLISLISNGIFNVLDFLSGFIR